MRIQSLRAFRQNIPGLLVVGRCLDFKAVGLFGELLHCPGHQMTSEAHRRWSNRGSGQKLYGNLLEMRPCPTIWNIWCYFDRTMYDVGRPGGHQIDGF